MNGCIAKISCCVWRILTYLPNKCVTLCVFLFKLFGNLWPAFLIQLLKKIVDIMKKCLCSVRLWRSGDGPDQADAKKSLVGAEPQECQNKGNKSNRKKQKKKSKGKSQRKAGAQKSKSVSDTVTAQPGRSSQLDTLQQKLNEKDHEIAVNKKALTEKDKKIEHISQQQERLAHERDCERSNNLEKDRIIHELKRQNEDLQTRFSKLASDKVTTKNPAIEDLSDVNRPMKIAERFRYDLYGSEWCNAYEEMEKLGKPEEDIVKILCTLCERIYEYCKYTASKQFEDINKLMMSPAGSGESGDVKTSALSLSSIQTLIQDRKNVKAETIDDLMRDFLKQLKEEDSTPGGEEMSKTAEVIQPFIHLCIECCWLMRIQDPPMALWYSTKHGEGVDRERFEVYQTAGNDVDYLVWPAVMREEHRGLVQKGIVECVKQMALPGAQQRLPARKSTEMTPPNSADVSSGPARVYPSGNNSQLAAGRDSANISKIIVQGKDK